MAVLIIAVASIGAATLFPSRPENVAYGPCIVCGEFGGVDVILNVLLFMPFGFALGLLNRRVLNAAMWACVVSAVIEIAQFSVVPGRHGNLGDILTNTLGATVGNSLARGQGVLLCPCARQARLLAIAYSLAWCGSRAFMAALFLPVDLPPPYFAQFRHSTGIPPRVFEGQIKSAALGGYPITDGPIAEHAVRSVFEVEQSVVLHVEAATRAMSRELVPIIRIVDRNDRDIVSLGQHESALTFGVRTVAQSLRLRPQRFRLANVLPDGHGRESVITARYQPRSVRLELAHGGVFHEGVIHPDIDGAWRAFLPWQTYDDDHHAWWGLDLLFALALLVPIGFWLHRSLPPRGTPSGLFAFMHVFVAAAFVIGTFMPWLFGMRMSVVDAVALPLGVAAGMLAAGAMRERQHSP